MIPSESSEPRTKMFFAFSRSGTSVSAHTISKAVVVLITLVVPQLSVLRDTFLFFSCVIHHEIFRACTDVCLYILYNLLGAHGSRSTQCKHGTCVTVCTRKHTVHSSPHRRRVCVLLVRTARLRSEFLCVPVPFCVGLAKVFCPFVGTYGTLGHRRRSGGSFHGHPGQESADALSLVCDLLAYSALFLTSTSMRSPPTVPP